MNRRSFVRRRPFSTLLLILLIVLCGYTAKEYCSCRYVMNNGPEYCRGYVKQWVPISGFTDDAASKSVTVSGLGRSNSAVWIGERQGCRLNP
jgi:hypothetical protein